MPGTTKLALPPSPFPTTEFTLSVMNRVPWGALRMKAQRLLACPYCKAPAGRRCHTTTSSGTNYRRYVHHDRITPLVTVWLLGYDSGARSVPTSGQAVA